MNLLKLISASLAIGSIATMMPARALTPLEGPIRVNQITAGEQRYPAVAASASGAFVVVWESEVQDRGATDIFARRYGPDGLPLGDQFRVNTFTPNRQVFPAVAMNASGQFVIAWDSAGQDGPTLNVYGQRFNADGTRNGGEFRINDGKRDVLARVGLAMDPGGGFVVVWPERKTPLPVAVTVRVNSINVRPFAADGTPRSDQVEVGTSVPTNLRVPAVGVGANGDFIVAWQSDIAQVLPVSGIAGGSPGIYVRRYSNAATALGPAVQVDKPASATGLSLPTLAAPASMSDRPALAVAADGGFVVAWQRNLADLTPVGVFARRYSATGTASGPEFRVGATSLPLRFPVLTIDGTGRTTIFGQCSGIYGQSFSASDAPLQTEQQLSDGTGDVAQLPSAAIDDSGRLIVTWQDFGGDGDGRGVIVRRYAP